MRTCALKSSVSLKSGCRKKSLSLDGPCCRDVILPLFLMFLFLRDVRTVIFDIVEYMIMEWTMPNESRVCNPKAKKKSVADQFAAVKYRSETYGWTQKLSREDYGVHKYFLLL